MFVILSECHGHLAYLRHGIVSEVIAESHIYLVSRVDEVFHRTLRTDAQSSGCACELVQLITPRARVHLLEFLIEGYDLLFCHTGVLLHVYHLVIHLRKVLYRVADGHSDACYACSHTCECCLVAVELIGYLSKCIGLFSCCLVHLLHLGAAGLDAVGKCLVFLRVPCHIARAQLFVERTHCLCEFLVARLRKVLDRCRKAIDIFLLLSDLGRDVIDVLLHVRG